MMRFSIRDLLWLTLLAAVAVAWWVDRTHSERERLKLVRQNRDLAASKAWQSARIEAYEEIISDQETSVNRLREILVRLPAGSDP